MSRPLSPAQLARNRLAGACAKGTPESVETARRALEEAKVDAQVKAIVDRAPELTPAQYEALARALAVAPAGDAA
jgi:hypothetical protein